MSQASCQRSSLLALLLLVATSSATPKAFIEGVTAECFNEGGPVQIPLIAKDPCISCICKNKEVVCKKESCSAIIGCHFVLHEQREKCCEVCKGCVFNGQEIRSSSQWSDPQNPCIFYTCQASVLTVSQVLCHVPCTHPLPPAPGECCSQCQGCLYNNVQYKEGDIIPFESDRCVVCVCKNGNITCTKRSCPVLACPKNKTVLKPGACCLECKGMRKVYELKNKCFLEHQIYKNGQEFQLDECTQCKCQGSTSVCERKTCPLLLCPTQFQILDKGECCASCRQEVAQQQCVSAGIEYQNEEMWKLDECSTCICRNGELRCHVEQCLDEVKECPAKHKLQKLPGDCCAQCVEDDAVCTIYGDPHYRTFDGLVFNFQGSCKYVLSEDCQGKTFSVRVRNDARSTASFSWTKTVFFKLGKTKVTLEQRMKIKVNRIPVSLPHIETGIVTITKEGYLIRVRSHLGVNIVWDGDSFLEISVPSSYKNKLCGMCGNYNSVQSDDFRTRLGNSVNDPTSFGMSWKIGSEKQCSRPEPAPTRSPICRNKGRNRHKYPECDMLMSEAFQACHSKVNPRRYLHSCYLDMCECPVKRRCYCEAFTAYSHECSKLKIELEWRNQTKCGGIICPKGAQYEACGPACVKTCRNWRVYKPCMKPCIAGCQCPQGTVLHRNRCIKPHRCPKRLTMIQ